MITKHGDDLGPSLCMALLRMPTPRNSDSKAAPSITDINSYSMYLEASEHCSNSGCDSAGLYQYKSTGGKRTRYCGQKCQLVHWPAHSLGQ